MGAPRHLWSGDWELESLARTEELAARRRRDLVEEAAKAAEPEPAPRGRRRRTWVLAGWWRTARIRRRQLRVASVVALMALIGAGAAYAVSSTLSGGGRQPPAAGRSQPWLGVEVASVAADRVMVVRVAPGSPAQAAGIKPGDVITQIDTEPIAAPAILTAAINGLQPGDRVEIQYQRGASTYTAQVTLASRPAGQR